jgi:hypothetical protein
MILNAITKTKTEEICHTTTVRISGGEIIDSEDLRITLENQLITQKLKQQISWYQKSEQVCSRPSS